MRRILFGRLSSAQSERRRHRFVGLNHSAWAAIVLCVVCLGAGCSFPLRTVAQPTPSAVTAELSPTPTPTATRVSPRSATNNIVIAIPADPPGFDPHVAVSPISFLITRNIYDTLVEVGERGTLAPRLAEEWSTNEDRTMWSFSLKDNIFFGNGQRLTARDVAYSIERLIGPATANVRAGEYGVIESIGISDTLSINFHLREPKVTLPLELANDWAAIVPDESGDQLYTRPIGTGPFRLKEWERGRYVALERFSDVTLSSGGLAIDDLVFRVVPTEADRIYALQSGEVDIVAGLSISATYELQGDRDISLFQIPAAEVKVLAFNHARPPFDDLRVRQAICYGIDRQALIEEVWYGAAAPAGTEFSASDPYRAELTDAYPHDAPRAQALLAQAGYDRGLDAGISVPNDDQYMRLAEALARQLAEIGVRLEIVPVDWTVFLNEVYFGREFDLTLMTHKGKTDPLTALARYKSGSSWNYLNYANSEYDQMIASVSASAPDELVEGLTSLQRFLVEDAMVAYLASPLITTAVRNEVKGCRLLPDGLCDLRTVYKEPVR